jgi:hypothetical protein
MHFFVGKKSRNRAAARLEPRQQHRNRISQTKKPQNHQNHKTNKNHKTTTGTIVHTGDWKIDEHPVDGDAFDRESFDLMR